MNKADLRELASASPTGNPQHSVVVAVLKSFIDRLARERGVRFGCGKS
jgi:hypothetical protein